MPKKFSEIEFEIMRVLISNGALFPMELVRASTRIRSGSVYVYLDRLKRKKWVRSFLHEAFSAPGEPVRRYQVTGLGMARYKLHTSDNPWAL